MNNLFGARVLVGLGLVVLVILGSCGISVYRTRQLHDDAVWVAHTHEVIGALSDVLSLMKDAETGQRGYLITSDAAFLEPYLTAKASVHKRLEDLSRLTVDNPSQQANLVRLRELVDARLAILDQNKAIHDQQGFAASRTAILEGRGKAAMDLLRAHAATMIDEERGLMDERAGQFARQFRTAVITGMTAAAVGLMMVAVFVNLLNKSFEQRRKAAEAVFREREQLHVTLASIGDGVIATDVAGKVTFLNPIAQALTGWRQQDAAGKALEEVFHIVNETTRETVVNPALRSLKEGTIVGLANHTVLIARDGSERAIADSAAPIRGLQGDMLGAVLVFRDVTEDRAVEKQLEASEARKSAILETALDCIISCDHDGRVVEFNPAAERTFGYRREEVLGRELGDLIVPHGLRDRHRGGLKRHVLSGQGSILNQRLELPALRADGTEFTAELAITRISGEGPPMFTAYLRDISDRKNAERRLDERLSLLELSADISRSLTNGETLAEELQACAEALVKHLHGAIARIWTYDEPTQMLQLQAGAGLKSQPYYSHETIPLGKHKIGMIAESRLPHMTNSVVGDERFVDQEWVRREGLVSFAGYPLVIDERVVGVMALFARHPLPEQTLATMAGIARDISLGIDRARAVRELRDQRELLQVTLASIGDAVLTTDAEGCVLYLNDIAEQLSGWSTADARGRPVEEVFHIVHEVTNEPVESPVRRVLAEGVIVGLANHTWLISKDGSRRPIDDSAAPIRDEQRRLVGTVLVFRDVTERRKTERRLRDISSRLQAALTAGSIGTWVWDIPADKTYADANLAQMFGVTPQAAEGGTQADFLSKVHPDDAPVVAGLVQQAIKTNGHYEAEFRIEREVDGIRWIVARGVVEYDDGGSPRQMNGVVVDITERKQAEQDFRALTEESERSRRLYETILSTTPDFVYTFNFEHQFTYANPALLRMFGRSFDEAVGKTFLEIGYEPWHAAMHEREIDEVVATKASIRGEVPFTGTHGTRIYDYIFSPVFAADGSVEAVAGTTRDVTERKQLEEHLRRVAAELSEANRRKNEFLATLAHELRNPLAPIRTGLELLKIGSSDRALVEQTRDMMERQALHMVRLIDDLLDISRITQGKLHLRLARVPLSDVIRTSVESVRLIMSDAGHAFDIRLPEEPVYLTADPSRLSQVVSNLLNNAAKYTPRGGRVELIVEADERHVVVRVKDTGLGIPAEMRERIFEMFAQIDRPLEQGYTGLGIGLTLVKRLVEMHEGSVAVHSEGEGRGSEFVVRLPRAAASEENHRTENTAPAVEVGPFRILVVDDNREAAETFAAVLRHSGHEVRVAHDGAQAVKLAESVRPDVVFMDLGMPHLNGYEAAEQIRKAPWGENIVLAALTGWGQEEDRRRTTSAGFDFHLTKPAEPSAVLRILQGVRDRRTDETSAGE
ncbi:MAG: hypothetical protein C0483_24930 [Pirellula sp.]|nr:hypothetical protein [Pirellula sp.]